MNANEEVQDILLDRRSQYGDTLKSFVGIAKLWSLYLELAGNPEALSTDDVAMMMILLKISRYTQGQGERDSILDIIGYANCIDICQKEQDPGWLYATRVVKNDD